MEPHAVTGLLSAGRDAPAAAPLTGAFPAAPTRRRRLAAFALLMVAEFLASWAWNTVDVLRPYIRASLHLSLTQAGSMYSAQGLGALAGAVVIGQLADRLGRRRTLPAIVVATGVMLAAGASVESYEALLVQRFALGFLYGGYFRYNRGD